MTEPLVSILIVVKDGERFLPSAFESIRRQAYSPIELILVDGHSTDRTETIARAVDGLRYISQIDDGLANARNCALQAARGELIAFLDADDVWASNKLHLQTAYLASHTDCLGTVTHLRFIIESQYRPHNRELDGHYRRVKVGYTPSALLAHRELFRMVGPFDPTYNLACDADWFARLFDAGLQVKVLPQTLLTKRIHNFNLSLDITKSRHETLRVLKSSMRRKRGAAGRDG